MVSEHRYHVETLGVAAAYAFPTFFHTVTITGGIDFRLYIEIVIHGFCNHLKANCTDPVFVTQPYLAQNVPLCICQFDSAGKTDLIFSTKLFARPMIGRIT